MAKNKEYGNGNGSKTFIKITNKDIFDKLEALETEVRKYNGYNNEKPTKSHDGRYYLSFAL